MIFVVHTCSNTRADCEITVMFKIGIQHFFFMLRLYYYRFPCFMIKQKLELAALCLSVFEYLTCFKLV